MKCLQIHKRPHLFVNNIIGQYRMQSHLVRGIDVDVLIENLLGFGLHLRRRHSLEILTRNPELNVLLAELRLQKGGEGSPSN